MNFSNAVFSQWKDFKDRHDSRADAEMALFVMLLEAMLVRDSGDTLVFEL